MSTPMPLPVDAATWLLGDRTGLSSLAIFRAAFGYPSRGRIDYPHDAADFGRCLNLVRTVPATLAGINVLAESSAMWREIRTRWDELVGLYDVRLWMDIRALLRSLEDATAADAGWVVLHAPTSETIENSILADAIGLQIGKAAPKRAARNRHRVGVYRLPILRGLEAKGFVRQVAAGGTGIVPHYDFEVTEAGMVHIRCPKRFIKQVLALKETAK